MLQNIMAQFPFPYTTISSNTLPHSDKSRLPATLFLPEQGMLNPHGKLHIFALQRINL